MRHIAIPGSLDDLDDLDDIVVEWLKQVSYEQYQV